MIKRMLKFQSSLGVLLSLRVGNMSFSLLDCLGAWPSQDAKVTAPFCPPLLISLCLMDLTSELWRTDLLYFTADFMNHKSKLTVTLLTSFVGLLVTTIITTSEIKLHTPVWECIVFDNESLFVGPSCNSSVLPLVCSVLIEILLSLLRFVVNS